MKPQPNNSKPRKAGKRAHTLAPIKELEEVKPLSICKGTHISTVQMPPVKT